VGERPQDHSTVCLPFRQEDDQQLLDLDPRRLLCCAGPRTIRSYPIEAGRSSVVLVERLMITFIWVLRALALALPFLIPLLVYLYRPRSETVAGAADAPKAKGERTPLMANIAALGVFFFLLFNPLFWLELPDSTALVLALGGLLVIVAGTLVVLWARAVLGSSWSFAPKASQASGLATTGPYSLIRHPIYLGMLLGFVGEAIAWASWAGMLAVLLFVLPTLLWRTVVEERLLISVFGQDYENYRKKTRRIVPYLL
jgi:protein-S-isoprenylcysteine O-methyltransferase Ste14